MWPPPPTVPSSKSGPPIQPPWPSATRLHVYSGFADAVFDAPSVVTAPTAAIATAAIDITAIRTFRMHTPPKILDGQQAFKRLGELPAKAFRRQNEELSADGIRG